MNLLFALLLFLSINARPLPPIQGRPPLQPVQTGNRLPSPRIPMPIGPRR
jgi:hypothetical protein